MHAVYGLLPGKWSKKIKYTFWKRYIVYDEEYKNLTSDEYKNMYIEYEKVLLMIMYMGQKISAKSPMQENSAVTLQMRWRDQLRLSWSTGIIIKFPYSLFLSEEQNLPFHSISEKRYFPHWDHKQEFYFHLIYI